MPRIDGRCSYIEGNSAVYKNSSLGPPSKRQKVKLVRWADITRDNSERLLSAVKSFIKFANGTLRSPITMGDNVAKSLTNIVKGCNDYASILDHLEHQNPHITADLIGIKNNAIQHFNQLIKNELTKTLTFDKLLSLKELCGLMEQALGDHNQLVLSSTKSVIQKIKGTSVSDYLDFSCEKYRCLVPYKK